jgi:hypothetical protein
VAAIERACGLRVGKLVVEQVTLRAAVNIDRVLPAHRPGLGRSRRAAALSFDAKGCLDRSVSSSIR